MNNELVRNDIIIVSKWRNTLMGLSALWIYIFHEWITLFQESGGSIAQVEYFIKRIGFCGVDIFFIQQIFTVSYGLYQRS